MKILIVGIAGTPKDFLLAPFVLKSYLYQFQDIKDKFDIVIQSYHINTNEKNIIEDINNIQPDILCFSCYIWNIRSIKHIIKQLNIKSKIILGGPEISRNDIVNGKYNGLNIDYIIFGEGERAFYSLLKQKTCKGLAINNNGTFECNISYDFLSDEDYKKTPSPYIYMNFDIKDLRINFETQRGCSNRCAYCLYHRNSPIIRYRNPNNVVDEIKYVFGKGINTCKIVDANFFSNKEHAKDILIGLIKNKIKMRISCDIIPKFVDNELIELCKKYIEQGGFILAGIGLQSLNKESMRLINRITELNHLNKAIKLLSYANVCIRIDTILGLPKETKKTYFKLINYVIDKMKLGNHYLGTYLLKILPGTTLEKIAVREKLIINKEQHDVYCTPTLSREDMLECLKLTAITFRFFNAENIDKKDKLSTLFFKKKQQLNISNLQLLKILNKKFKEFLYNTKSNFVHPDFLDAENYYFKQFKQDLPDNDLIEIVNNIK